MFDRLGALVSGHWRPVIFAWLLLAAFSHTVAPRANDVTHDGDLAYLPEGLPSIVGERLLSRAFPEHLAKSQMGIVVERPDGPLKSADLQWSDSLADLFRARQ